MANVTNTVTFQVQMESGSFSEEELLTFWNALNDFLLHLDRLKAGYRRSEMYLNGVVWFPAPEEEVTHDG